MPRLRVPVPDQQVRCWKSLTVTAPVLRQARGGRTRPPRLRVASANDRIKAVADKMLCQASRVDRLENVPSKRQDAALSGTILFVDHAQWKSFDQLSAVLRKRGFRTVRVTTEQSRFSRRVAPFCYDETIYVDDIAAGFDDALSRAQVAPTDILDLQCADSTLDAVVSWLARVELREFVRDHMRWKAGLIDKLAMSQRLSAAGVPVPRALDADTTTPLQASQDLGFPLLLKSRLGGGGAGVRIFQDEVGLRDIVDDPARRKGKQYWEEFIPGTLVAYGAAYRDGQVLHEGTVLSVRWNERSLGPSMSVRTTADEDLIDVGRKVLAAIHGRGLANLGCVRSSDGQVRVFDVNLRIWGSAHTLGQAGVGFGEAYILTLEENPEQPRSTSRVEPGHELRVFPTASLLAASTQPWKAIAFALRDLPYYIRSAGWRCAFVGSAEIALALLKRAKRSASKRVRTSSTQQWAK
jgi:hypothetical protein